jgi:predicted dehydrogenase
MGLAHAKAWQSVGAQVASVSSRNAVPWVGEAGHLAVRDFREAIDSPDVDVVDVCLPTPLHRAAAEHALAAGRHVLLEKPIALSVSDADAIVAAGEASDAQLMVAHVVRFFPGYRVLREVVDSGRIGAPIAATAARLAAGSSNIAWIRDVEQSGGVTVDLLVHDYDQLNLFLGRPASVYARVSDERSVAVTVDYGGGRVGTAEGSTAMPAGYRFSTLLRVRCRSGVIEYATGECGDGGVVRIWPDDGGVEQVQVPATDPYQEQARYFLDRISSGEPVEEGTAEQARAAAAVGAAALRSASTGVPEPLR